MTSPGERLTSLGRIIREAEDTVAARTQPTIDSRLLTVQRRPRMSAVLLGLVLAATAAVVLFMTRSPALTFEVGGEPGTAGQWIAAEAVGTSLTFSDGSLVLLENAARVRVENVEAAGARIAVESGGVSVKVVHRRTSHWVIAAGPFTIAVVGTEFSVTWDPAAQRFGLTLRQGGVTVSGPIIGDSHRVRQGESLAIFAGEGRVEVRQLGTLSPTAPALADSMSASATTSPATPQVAPVPLPSVSDHVRGKIALQSPRAVTDWRSLALSNRYRDAFAAADATGFDLICDTATAPDIRLLGDTARLAGKPSYASHAFELMRIRFPGSDEAATAAFLLGKLNYEALHSYGTAATWFSKYLAERPDGPLAREAAGRMIEARRNNGDEVGARRAAQDYLNRYPEGPHAPLARKVMGE